MFEWGLRSGAPATLVGAPTASAPGAGLPLAVELAALEPRRLDAYALVEAVAGWERVISWAHAQQASAINEMSRRALSGREMDLVPDKVAACLAATRRSAELKVELAASLDRSPQVFAALSCGTIDVRKATVLTNETAHLPLEDAHALHDRFLPEAPDLTAPQLRNAVRRAELSLDAAAAEKRAERARARRSVTLTPTSCSMAWVTAYLPAPDAMRVMTAVDALAASCGPEDCRGIDARRADALVDVMARVLDEGVGPHGPLPTRQHRRPHLLVTASATTLLGLDDAPGALAGYGPIPAAMARDIAAVSTWRAVLTDQRSGELVARSAQTYRPPSGLAGLVVDRDSTCTFPGCRVPATRCDIDHIRPFDQGRPPAGQTHADNLHALCRHHHRLKTHGRWSPVRDPQTGRTWWQAPTGHTYTRDPVPTDPTDRPFTPRRPRPVRDDDVRPALPIDVHPPDAPDTATTPPDGADGATLPPIAPDRAALDAPDTASPPPDARELDVPPVREPFDDVPPF